MLDVSVTPVFTTIQTEQCFTTNKLVNFTMPEDSNSAMNGTHPTSCFSNPAAVKIGRTFAYCLIFIVSLAGNTLVGIIVYKTKAMRTSTNFLLVNMAMSDLLLPIFLFPSIITGLYVDSWLIGGPLGQALCKLHVFFSNVSTNVSIQSLVLIALDRFGAVVFPLRSPLISPKLCLFFIAATWIIAIAVQSPHLFAFRLVQYSETLICARRWNEAFGDSSSFINYILAMFVIFFCMPLVLMAVLYFIIVLKVKSQTPPGEQSVMSAAQQRREKRERNVLKLVIAIVLSFAVCWMPFTIFTLLGKVPCGTIYYVVIARILASANCAINPCICLIFSRNYRRGLKSLLNCCVSLQTSNQVAPIGS